MNNIAQGIIFSSGDENKMNELTLHRTTASLPFGGRYRFIDFALSNFVNSGITAVGIIAASNYLSLMDHLRMGRDWDLNRKNSGIAVFPPYANNTSESMARGKIDALYGIKDYFEGSKEEYVIITNGNIAGNIDLDAAVEKHKENGADITVVTYEGKPTTSKRYIIKCKKGGRVTDILCSKRAGNKNEEISLNTYIIKKSLLLELLEDANEHNLADFEKDILQSKVGELKIFAYEVGGYAAIIDDINSYYGESMRLLDADVRNDLFFRNGQIFTKVKDSVPTLYKAGAAVKNSLIADGCIINGTVENSILFRGVTVEAGAIIKNSIIMESGTIMADSILNYVISDKNVTVRQGRNLSGHSTYPEVIVKGKEV